MHHPRHHLYATCSTKWRCVPSALLRHVPFIPPAPCCMKHVKNLLTLLYFLSLVARCETFYKTSLQVLELWNLFSRGGSLGSTALQRGRISGSCCSSDSLSRATLHHFHRYSSVINRHERMHLPFLLLQFSRSWSNTPVNVNGHKYRLAHTSPHSPFLGC